jgi:hypothetical protein
MQLERSLALSETHKDKHTGPSLRPSSSMDNRTGTPQHPTPHHPIDQSSNLARYSHLNARPVSREPYEPSNARYLHPSSDKKALHLNNRTSSHELSKQPHNPNPRYGSEMKTLNNYFNKSSTPQNHPVQHSQKKPKYELRLNLHSQNPHYNMDPHNPKPPNPPPNPLQNPPNNPSPIPAHKPKDDLTCSPYLSPSHKGTYGDDLNKNNNSLGQNDSDSLYRKGLINPVALKGNY